VFKFFKAAAENKVLQQNLSELTKQHQAIEAECLAQREQLSSLKAELTQLQALELSQTQDRIQELTQLQQTVLNLEAELAASQAHNQALQTEQNALTQTLEQVKLALQQSQEQVEQVRSQADQAATEATAQAELTTVLANIQAELASWKERYLRLELQSRDLNQQLEHLKEVRSAPSTDHRRPEDLKILIVDDSITTRTLMKKILEAAGYQVLLAKDGLEGQAQFANQLPNLVVSDIEMPEMDGFALTHWIKHISDAPKTPVILITSLVDDEFKSRGKEVGADGFITKNNFNQQYFLTTVENHLLSTPVNV